MKKVMAVFLPVVVLMSGTGCNFIDRITTAIGGKKPINREVCFLIITPCKFNDAKKKFEDKIFFDNDCRNTYHTIKNGLLEAKGKRKWSTMYYQGDSDKKKFYRRLLMAARENPDDGLLKFLSKELKFQRKHVKATEAIVYGFLVDNGNDTAVFATMEAYDILENKRVSKTRTIPTGNKLIWDEELAALAADLAEKLYR